MMNTLLNRFLIFLTVIAFAGCESSDDTTTLPGDWTRKADFEGVSRSDAAAFVINDIAYLGTGFTSSTSTTENRLADFWKYDPDQDNWYSIANFPGKARSKAVSFTANGKGYVGLGTDGTNLLNDFWEYTPETNAWKQVANFPVAKGRYGAVAFGIGDYGYVGCGNDGDNDQQDFYQYNSSANSWTQVASIKSKRVYPFVFVIDGIAYVGGGMNNGSYVNSFYAYNPASNEWVRKHALYPDGDDEETDEIQNNDDYNYNLQRTSAISFTLNGLGYITTGTYSSLLNTTWQYNPSKDLWVQADNFEGSSREGAVGFALKNLGYVATGRSGTSRYDDLWRFNPDVSDDD